jgi:uncharacterized membrane protein YgaE (UPF0421/DUF939 family)/predicted amino acid-binding ACT domain protein
MIGARVWKTAIAVTIAILVAQRLEMHTFHFAGIIAVLAVQPSIYRSFRYAVQLAISAVIAAWLGAAVLFTLGDSFYAMGLVALLLMVLHVRMRWTNAFLVAVVVGINTMGTIGLGFPEAAWNMMALVLIGIVSGTLVNMIRKPVHQERAEVVLKQSEGMLRVLLSFIVIDLERQRITPYGMVNQQAVEIAAYIKRGKEIAAFAKEDGKLRQVQLMDTANIFQSFERMLDCIRSIARTLADVEPVTEELAFLRKSLQLTGKMQENVMLGRKIHPRGFIRVLEHKREQMWQQRDGTEHAATFLAYFNAYDYVQQYVKELALFLAEKEGLIQWRLTYASIDRPGLLAEVSAVLQRHQLNINQVSIRSGTNFAQTSVEVTSRTELDVDRVAKQITSIDNVLKAEIMRTTLSK